jgi:hypothetical protein
MPTLVMVGQLSVKRSEAFSVLLSDEHLHSGHLADVFIQNHL